MSTGEIEQLKSIISNLRNAIEVQSTESIYDITAQATALYGTDVSQIIDAFETLKSSSGLVYRQSKVILQLLLRYLSQSEVHPTEQGENQMSVNSYKQKVYRVMIAVLGIPDASPNTVAEKCGINISELFCILEFTNTEGLLSGMQIQHGGQGNVPLMVFYSNVQRTMKGLEFMQQFEKEGTPQISGSERPTVFISYNWSSGSDFADSLETRLLPCATVLRDKSSLDDWESFSSFMKSIRIQDFAVLVVTKEYLKSEVCMYEVSELMRDDGWQEKVMFAVLDQDIYSIGVGEFLKYWQDKKRVLWEESKQLEPQNMESESRKINKVISIQQCFGRFYEAVCDAHNPKAWDAIDRIIAHIKQEANKNFADSLDNKDYEQRKNEEVQRLLD